jgi:DNA-binding NarL/FixJ family response regulator
MTTAPAHPRVLLVDDSPLVHMLVRVALEKGAGWDVVSAASGAEALEHCAAARFDAMLVDVEMPEMDGPATVRALDAAGADAPKLFLTGHDDESRLERLRALGVAGIVPKPFDAATLAQTIADRLGWSR